MTEQEAVCCLEEQIKIQPCGNVALAFELAIKALEMQIAKKLIGGYKCASCGNDVTETCYHIDFCPFCGQKLDWSEV